MPATMARPSRDGVRGAFPYGVTAASAQDRPTLPAVSRRVVAGLGFLAAAVCLLGVALSAAAEPVHAVLWGSLALAAEAAGLLYLVNVAAGDQAGLGLARWKLGPWIMVWYGLAFGIASVTWASPQTSPAAQIALTSVLRALWLVAVGMIAWALGYAAGPGRLLRRLATRWVAALACRCGGTVRSRSTPWLLYAVGALARLASAATTGRFGYVGDAASAVSTASSYGQILSDISLLAPLAVAAAAIQVYWERLPGARITLAILFATEVAFGAAAGGKESFVIALLAVLIPMSAARRHLPVPAVIAGVLVFLVIVIPFNQAYRAVARDGSTTLSASQAVHQAPAIFQQTVTGHSVMTVVPDSFIYLLQRIREIDSPAIILQRTPSQIPYANPVQLAESPVADLVPRAIWPGKPIMDTGYQFSQQYYGLPSSLYTSSAITPVGDLYRHGGWIPVIAGMAVLGCVVRLLDGVLNVRANPQAILLVLLLFPALVKGEDDWVALLVSIPGTLLVWLVAVAVLFRPLSLRRSA
jgi:hypothetical protein